MVEGFLFRAVLVALLIFANGFFVAAELALVSLRTTRLRQMVDSGRVGARSVLRLQSHMDEFLPAVQFGVTLASLALGWIGEPTVFSLLEPLLPHAPHIAVYAHIVAVAIAFSVITYFHVLLGEIVPKSLALARAEQIALAVAPPMEFFMKATRPAVVLLNRSARGVLTLFRAHPAGSGGTHNPEELKLLATASRNSGMLPALEEQVIHRALELSQIEVREIMTPRGKIFSLPADLRVEDASARIVEDEHSRIPVYDPQLGPEHIIGIVYAKDISRLMHFRMTAQVRLAQLSGEGTGQVPVREMRLRQIMREPLVVPESKSVSSVMVEFQQQRRHLAIVVDEFGTTVGLVTVEDALEQLVGEIEDEFDVATRPALNTVPGVVLLEGSENLRDAETALGMKLPKDDAIETIAGFLLAQMGRIPAEGDAVEYEGRRFKVTQMQGRRIGRVRVETLPEQRSLLDMDDIADDAQESPE
jgi:CBS domain containing-hemolysin-like protein